MPIRHRLLGVKKSTNLSALYSELGRKPLLVFLEKIDSLSTGLKYLTQIIFFCKNVYCMLFDDIIAGNNYNWQNWAFQIKKKHPQQFRIRPCME